MLSVAKHLITFLVAFFIITVAFAHAFFLLFLEGPYCNGNSRPGDPRPDDPRPFCNFKMSYLKVCQKVSIGKYILAILTNKFPHLYLYAWLLFCGGGFHYAVSNDEKTKILPSVCTSVKI